MILAYKKPPDPSAAAAFLAEVRTPGGDGVQVVVKFAYKYDRDAHDASSQGPARVR